MQPQLITDTNKHKHCARLTEINCSPIQSTQDMVVQGLCLTVSVTFDNQKVREHQYGMEDFRTEDENEESEEEWDGDFEEDTAVAF